MALYRFGEFVFDSHTGELQGDGQVVEMRPKVAHLLALFLENRGNLLTKSIIMERVWAETAVSDQVLFQAIRELRTHLGSSARDERFIQNFPKKGYKWVFEIEEGREVVPVTHPNTTLSTYRLDRFEMECLIGSGGMASVWKARDTKLNRDVAIKTFRSPSILEDTQLRFKREMVALAAFNHPCIAQIYEVGEGYWPPENPTLVPFLVMEMVKGETLRTWLKRHRPSTSEALSLARQLLEGLAVAHDRGIVHRDIKPENIMVTDEGHIKILDLGLAKLAADLTPSPQVTHESDDTPNLTREGVFVGTPGYLAPEQLENLAVDIRADIFSFGAVFFEMICHKPLFRAGPMHEQLASLMCFEFDPSLLPTSARAFSQVLVRCLNSDRNRRYHHARDVLLDLEDTPEHSFSWVRPLIGLGLLAIGLWLGLLVAGLKQTEPPQANMRILAQETNYSVLAPDVSMFAYSKVNQPGIWVAPIGPGESRRILDRELVGNLATDPRGEFLFFDAVDAEQHAAIFEVPWSGGSPRRITSGWWPAVSSDGTKVACFDQRDHKNVLIVVNRDGTDRTEWLVLEGADEPYGLAFDKDELILSRTDGYHHASLFRVNEKGDLTTIAQVAGWCGRGLAVAGDGSVVWSVLEADGLGPNLVLSGPRHQPFTRVFSFPGRFRSPSLDQSRAHLLVRHEQVTTRLMAWNLSEEPDPRIPALVDRFECSQPRFDPTGERLAYLTRNYEIWVLDLRDGSTYPAIATGVASCNPAWSPEGDRLAYSSVSETQSDLWIAGVDGSNARPLTQDMANDFQPVWHPDGKSIYWVTDRDGVEEVFRMTLNTGEMKRCMEGVNPSISADGRFLAAVIRSSTTQSLHVAELDRDGTIVNERFVINRARSAGKAGMRPRFSPDSRELVFDEMDVQGRIRVVALMLDNPAQSRVLWQLPDGASLSNWYDWHGSLMVGGVVSATSQLILVPDFDRWVSVFSP
ncbi:MAG: protein kinase [Acidobacteria bacterium]|nr:protein kinase [Acidobacteriota bacterium]